MNPSRSRAASTSRLFVGILSVSALGMSGSALAATANIPVTASILPPISLSQPSDMRFGPISPVATAGTVTLALPATLPSTPPTTAAPYMAGTRSATGGVLRVGGNTCSASVLCGAGAVQVSGPLSGSFATVTLPASLTLTSGGDTMLVDNLRKRYGTAGTAGVTTGSAAFSAAGSAIVMLTGRLNVGALQAAGNYTGVLVVTVDY